MKRNTLIIAIAATAAAASAQDLRTEITVDRTVQPVLREMHRIGGVTPVIPAPNLSPSSIEAAEYTDPGIIESQIGVLPPAAWADSISRTPYRGYASVGYLPLYNLEANIGYRLIDSEKAGLGFWAQYDGNSYNGDIPDFDGALFTNHNATLGGNFRVRATRHSLFQGDGYATLTSTRIPYYYSVNGDQFRRSYSQSSKQIFGHGRWSSRTGQAIYAFDGTLGYFALGDDRPELIRSLNNPVKQAYGRGALSIGIADDHSATPWLGINISASALRSMDLPVKVNSMNTSYHTKTMTLWNVAPYVGFDNGAGLKGRIGAKVNFGTGYFPKTTVAPEISVSWAPIDFFSIYAQADGGQYFNYMAHLMEQNPYLDPAVAFGRTNMPWIVRGGLKVGPYEGMELGVYGGYAKARDILSPLITIVRTGLMLSSMEQSDVNSWYVGAHVGFAFRQWFSLSFDIKYGESDNETHSWYEWIDAAKVVSDVKLEVHPITALTITASYNMRYDRKARAVLYPPEENSSIIYVATPNLGTINEVNLAAAYSINPRLTAFVNIENLLSCRYKLISFMPAQGIHGIVGAAYKF